MTADVREQLPGFSHPKERRLRRLYVRSAWLAGAVLLTGFAIHAGSPHRVHVTLRWAAGACGASAAFGILYMLAAAALTRRFLARPCAEPSSFPGVTIIKPLHGNEQALLDNLSGFCRQDYAGPVQYLFGVHDKTDPALDVVEQLRQLHPQAEIAIVVDSRLYGPNRKMSNILNMLPDARHDILVFADSDVGVGPTCVVLSASCKRRGSAWSPVFIEGCRMPVSGPACPPRRVTTSSCQAS
jgi:ceramide glucosyltransferase